MLLQVDLTQRIISVLIFQIWPIIYSSYFAYKLLKRGKNRSTYTLSAINISLALTFFLACLSVLFIFTPFSYVLYIISIYFFFFSHSLLVIFTWVLVRLDGKTPYWKFHIGITFYGIVSSFVFWIGFFLKGIRLDSSTGWVPIYSWLFLSFSWTLLFIFVIVPQIYLSFKLLKVFEGIILKRRINMFIVSVFLEFTVVVSLFLYNTWVENWIFQRFYIITMPVTASIAAFLIYKSFGKELD
jgi:hypothetical protein